MGSFPSQKQDEAIRAQGNLLVAAAAGSGKTSVLTSRIVRAAIDLHVPVEKIAAVTFTELAAGEIRERVGGRFAAMGRHDLAAALERAPIGTIHSFCGRHLREFAHAAGLDPGFAVLDEVQAGYLRRVAVREAIDVACAEGDALRMRARYDDGRITAHVLAAWAAAAQRVDGIACFGHDRLRGSAARDAAVLQRVYDCFVERYEQAKVDAGGLDFDDLQRHMLRLLADDDIAARMRRGIDVLLVDEFQDTNALQCAIFDRLALPETFTVGDECQSIYRFRKADVAVFRERARSTHVLRMDENFRSHDEVIELVNGMFARAFVHEGDGDGYQPVAATRGAYGERCELILCHKPEPEHDDDPGCDDTAYRPDEGDCWKAIDVEFHAVAHRIAELLQRDDVQEGDIVVLMSASSKANRMRDVLARFGVRSVTSQSKGYGDHMEVRDLLALLRWVRNRHDSRAALSVLAAPYIGMALGDMYELRFEHAPPAGGDDWRPVRPALHEAIEASDHPACRRALELREHLARVAREGSLVELVSAAIHDSGYASHVLSRHDGRRRYANLRKLLTLASGAAGIGANDIASFLDLYEAQQRSDTDYGEASIADERTGAVRIMTIHASKGLEFPYVFVADCANPGATDATKPRCLVDGDGRVWFETVDAAGLQTVVPEGLEQLREHEAAEQLEEEKRKYYVAFTRAQRRLYIAGSLQRGWEGSALGWICTALDVDAKEVEAGPHGTLPLTITVERRVTSPPAGAAIGTDHVVQQLASNLVEPMAPAATVEDGFDAAAWRARRRFDERHRFAAERGERLHHLLAQALEHAVARGVPAVLQRYGAHEGIGAVVASDVFAMLATAGARAEVPFTTACERGCCARQGYFDALAARDAAWDVVDYKTALDADADVAWQEHHEQMERYARAALAAGAPQVTVTLLDIGDPSRRVRRTFTADDISPVLVHEPAQLPVTQRGG